MTASSPTIRAAVAGFAALAVVHALRVLSSLFADDAFIFMRYARNLLRGDGLVWNVGEPPIEGFTSLLHVLLLAAGGSTGLTLEATAQLLGLAGAAASTVVAALLARELSGGSGAAALVAAAMTSASTALAFWARSGMETTTFAALLGLALWLWLRDQRRGASRWPSSLALLAATLGRPEGAGVAILLAIADAKRGWSEAGPKEAVTRVLAFWPYAVGMLGTILFRLLYFGELLPNTYHAKSGGGLMALEAGLGYLAGFLIAFGPVGLGLLVAALVLRTADRPDALRADRRTVAVVIGIYAAHVAWLGGDYVRLWRYLVPLLPPMAALSAVGAALVWKRMRDRAAGFRAVAAVVGLAILLAPLARVSIGTFRENPALLLRSWPLVDHALIDELEFVKVGRTLNEVVPPDATIAAMAVGAVGYYSDRPILDMLGLNDRRIARIQPDLSRYERWTPGHMKGDASEILARRPDYVILSLRPLAEADKPPAERDRLRYPFVSDLLADPEFGRLYTLESHRMPGNLWLNLYRLGPGS